MKKLPAVRFAQLCWKPKIGDPVFLRGKSIKTTVSEVLPDGYIRLKNSNMDHKLGQLEYRPNPKDYANILLALKKAFAYLEMKSPSGHLVGAVPVNGRNVILTGKARKILIGLLELRGIDYRINDQVNEALNKLRPTGEGKSGVIRIQQNNNPSG